ncbi:hypothetical protein [Mucilaginibacter sp.]|uniref:hypothetical protein n=1 Tax=Mucilaginibacter sp. TaxID=1882438 RepID=UPI003D152D9E
MKPKTILIAIALISPISCLAAAQPSETHPTITETWIAFLPPIFFLLVLMITTFKLKKSDTKLSDLLAEKDVPAAVLAAPDPPQSVSRFIAFLTGLVALLTGVCLTTFFMYTYFGNPNKTVDLSNLSTVIWGLGIGVLPYGFNKAAAAVK